jgi:hypothetical protein
MPRSSTIVKLFALSSFLCLATTVQGQSLSPAQSPAREIPTDVTRTPLTVDQVIERAEQYFKFGKLNLEDNKRDAARADFDRAIDEILMSGFDVRANKRLESFYTELVERIYREEVPLTQQRSSSKPIVESSATPTPTPVIGFRERGFEPSPLDPLSKLIFPEPQDKPAENNNVIRYHAIKGDTIAKVATEHGLSVEAVSKLNGIAANAHVRTAEQRRKSMEQSLFFAGANGETIAMNHILWFRDQVKKGGPWDYNHSKMRTPEEIKSSMYDSFGNFHYGAVGAAAGFDLPTLLRAAGYAQETSGDTKGTGGWSGGLVGVFTGINSKAPYGDKAEDQEAIKQGYAYYQRGCARQ